MSGRLRGWRGCTVALALAMMASQPVAAAPKPVAGADTPAFAIDRCFELRDRAPADAMALARTTLAASALAPDDEIKLQSCLARAAALAGHVETASAAVEQVEALLMRTPQPPDFTLRALSNAGAALQTTGQVSRALHLYQRAFEAAQAGESNLAQVRMLGNVASIQSEHLGAHTLAEHSFAQAQAIADANGLSEPLLRYNRGMNFLRLRQPGAARAQFEAALVAVEGQDLAVVERRLRAELAALDGGVDAIDRLALLARAQTTDDPAGAALARLRMSQLALASGRTADALTEADASLALATDGGFDVERREAQRARVAALHAAGDLDSAFEALERLQEDELDALRGQNLGALAELQARLAEGRSAVELERLREAQRTDALNARHARALRDVGAAALVLLVLLASAFAWYQRRTSRALYRLSVMDSLTGLFNRRAATRAMQALVPPSDPALRHVAFLVDVDHFKRINDAHGHGVGDAILVEIARRFEAACRSGDLVVRWGGEEFLVVGTSLDLGQACDIAERLRRSIADTPVAIGDTQVPTAVSIGFACHAGPAAHDAWRDAIDLADRALYASKCSGRDAWTGLWFEHASDADAQQALRRDPMAEIAAGRLQAVGSRAPIRWPDGPSAAATPLPDAA